MNNAADTGRTLTIYTSEGNYTIDLDEEARYREAKRQSDADDAYEVLAAMHPDEIADDE
jgi:hypothetical protein